MDSQERREMPCCRCFGTASTDCECVCHDHDGCTERITALEAELASLTADKEKVQRRLTEVESQRDQGLSLLLDGSYQQAKMESRDLKEKVVQLEAELAKANQALYGAIQQQCACVNDGNTVTDPCEMHADWKNAALYVETYAADLLQRDGKEKDEEIASLRKALTEIIDELRFSESFLAQTAIEKAETALKS